MFVFVFVFVFVFCLEEEESVEMNGRKVHKMRSHNSEVRSCSKRSEWNELRMFPSYISLHFYFFLQLACVAPFFLRDFDFKRNLI